MTVRAIDFFRMLDDAPRVELMRGTMRKIQAGPYEGHKWTKGQNIYYTIQMDGQEFGVCFLGERKLPDGTEDYKFLGKHVWTRSPPTPEQVMKLRLHI